MEIDTYRNQLTDLEDVTLSPNSLLICAPGYATLSFQLYVPFSVEHRGISGDAL